MINRLVVAAMIGVASSVAQADETIQPRIVTTIRVVFGGTMPPVTHFEAGSSLALRDETEPFEDHVLGVSGVAYSTTFGMTPLMFGQQMHRHAPQSTAAAEPSSIPWGWIAAGAAAVAGIVLAGGSGDDPAEADGPTDENTCVYGGVENPDVDESCLDGP